MIGCGLVLLWLTVPTCAAVALAMHKNGTWRWRYLLTSSECLGYTAGGIALVVTGAIMFRRSSKR